jgi:hypothetical protein
MVQAIKWWPDALKWRPNNGTLPEWLMNAEEKNGCVRRLHCGPQDVRRVPGSGELMSATPLQDLENFSNFNNRLESIQQKDTVTRDFLLRVSME